MILSILLMHFNKYIHIHRFSPQTLILSLTFQAEELLQESNASYVQGR